MRMDARKLPAPAKWRMELRLTGKLLLQRGGDWIPRMIGKLVTPAKRSKDALRNKEISCSSGAEIGCPA